MVIERYLLGWAINDDYSPKIIEFEQPEPPLRIWSRQLVKAKVKLRVLLVRICYFTKALLLKLYYSLYTWKIEFIAPFSSNLWLKATLSVSYTSVGKFNILVLLKILLKGKYRLIRVDNMLNIVKN